MLDGENYAKRCLEELFKMTKDVCAVCEKDNYDEKSIMIHTGDIKHWVCGECVFAIVQTYKRM